MKINRMVEDAKTKEEGSFLFQDSTVDATHVNDDVDLLEVRHCFLTMI